MTDLRDLPPDHPLRNEKLSVVNPLHRFRGDTLKPKPCGHWKIGKATYNELAPFWHECGEFLVQLP